MKSDFVTLKDPIERGLKVVVSTSRKSVDGSSYTQRPDRKGTEREYHSRLNMVDDSLRYTQRPDRKGTERAPATHPTAHSGGFVTLKDPIERGLKDNFKFLYDGTN